MNIADNLNNQQNQRNINFVEADETEDDIEKTSDGYSRPFEDRWKQAKEENRLDEDRVIAAGAIDKLRPLISSPSIEEGIRSSMRTGSAGADDREAKARAYMAAHPEPGVSPAMIEEAAAAAREAPSAKEEAERRAEMKNLLVAQKEAAPTPRKVVSKTERIFGALGRGILNLGEKGWKEGVAKLDEAAKKAARSMAPPIPGGKWMAEKLYSLGKEGLKRAGRALAGSMGGEAEQTRAIVAILLESSEPMSSIVGNWDPEIFESFLGTITSTTMAVGTGASVVTGSTRVSAGVGNWYLLCCPYYDEQWLVSYDHTIQRGYSMGFTYTSSGVEMESPFISLQSLADDGDLGTLFRALRPTGRIGNGEAIQRAFIASRANLVAGRVGSNAVILTKLMVLMDQTVPLSTEPGSALAANMKVELQNPFYGVEPNYWWTLSPNYVLVMPVVEARVASITSFINEGSYFTKRYPAGWTRELWGSEVAIVPVTNELRTHWQAAVAWTFAHMEHPFRQVAWNAIGGEIEGVATRGGSSAPYNSGFRFPGPTAKVLFVVLDAVEEKPTFGGVAVSPTVDVTFATHEVSMASLDIGSELDDWYTNVSAIRSGVNVAIYAWFRMLGSRDDSVTAVLAAAEACMRCPVRSAYRYSNQYNNAFKYDETGSITWDTTSYVDLTLGAVNIYRGGSTTPQGVTSITKSSIREGRTTHLMAGADSWFETLMMAGYIRPKILVESMPSMSTGRTVAMTYDVGRMTAACFDTWLAHTGLSANEFYAPTVAVGSRSSALRQELEGAWNDWFNRALNTSLCAQRMHTINVPSLGQVFASSVARVPTVAFGGTPLLHLSAPLYPTDGFVRLASMFVRAFESGGSYYYVFALPDHFDQVAQYLGSVLINCISQYSNLSDLKIATEDLHYDYGLRGTFLYPTSAVEADYNYSNHVYTTGKVWSREPIPIGGVMPSVSWDLDKDLFLIIRGDRSYAQQVVEGPHPTHFSSDTLGIVSMNPLGFRGAAMSRMRTFYEKFRESTGVRATEDDGSGDPNREA
jgi:hypothetical protein